MIRETLVSFEEILESKNHQDWGKSRWTGVVRESIYDITSLH
jgi:hypothetical protein